MRGRTREQGGFGVVLRAAGVSWAVASAVVLAVAGSAPAATTSAGPAGSVPRSLLTVTIYPGEQPSGTLLASALLTCQPDGGTHPKAKAACAELLVADGNPAAIPAVKEVCPMIFSPVAVQAKGRWIGKRVSFVHSYPNRCVAGHAAGALFAI